MKPLFQLFKLLLASAVLVACSSSKEKPFVTDSAISIITQDVHYTSGGKTMHGFLAVPEGEGPFPGVLVVHEWWGQTGFAREKAKKMALNGYVAFAVDMYGGGKTLDHPKEAKAFSSKVMSDLDEAEKSFRAALATLKAQEKVDPQKTAAIGYCFGGAIVLEMARRGLDLDLVVSYHGNLTPLVENDIPKTKTRVLIFNGGADTFVSKKDLHTVRKKLKAAKVRYKLVNYKGAKHGFTNPEATAMGEKYNLPLEYDSRADQKSWEETLNAFGIVFKKS